MKTRIVLIVMTIVTIISAATAVIITKRVLKEYDNQITSLEEERK